MSNLTAYIPRTTDSKQEAHWERIISPPFVTTYGQNDFVQLPDNRRVHGYVNGFKVIGGLQVIHSGDLVRVRGPEKKEISFRFAGRVADPNVEPGNGQTCAFTRTTINGMAVRCPICSKIVSMKVVEQIGSCVCGNSLSESSGSEPPPEELI